MIRKHLFSLLIVSALVVSGGLFVYLKSDQTVTLAMVERNISSPIRDCGFEDLDSMTSDVQINNTGRACIYEAYTSCTPARFTSIHHSLEGGRYISTLLVTGESDEGCRLFYLLDASDYWALGTILSGYCYDLTLVERNYHGIYGQSIKLVQLNRCDDSLSDRTQF